jgi:hypothetical protein
MSRGAASPPVEPRLFQLLSRYAGDLKEGRIDLRKPLKQSDLVVEFCRTFFQQFFENELTLEIVGVDQIARQQAARLRIGLEQDASTKPTRDVIRSFEDLCDMWPDVLGFSYGGLPTEYRRFHATFMPRLLDRIIRWSKERGYSQIATAANTAKRDYAPAIERL